MIEKTLFVININRLVDVEGGRQCFADAIGVTYEAVRQWCIGKKIPDGQRLITIQERFNVSIDWLLTGDGGEIQRGFLHHGNAHESVRDNSEKHHTDATATNPEIVIACQAVRRIFEFGDRIIIDALKSNIIAFDESIIQRKTIEALQDDIADVKKEMIEVKRIQSLKHDTGTG